MLQFGADGTVGAGVITASDAPGVLLMEQAFAGLDGGTRRTRHETRDEGAVHATTSFRLVDGAWVKDRSYAWRRTPAPEPAPSGGR